MTPTNTLKETLENIRESLIDEKIYEIRQEIGEDEGPEAVYRLARNDVDQRFPELLDLIEQQEG